MLYRQGLPRIVPVSQGWVERSADWVQRFNAAVVLPYHDEPVNYPFPVVAASPSAIVGVSFVQAAAADSGFQWCFRWRNKIVATSKRAQPGDILLWENRAEIPPSAK